MIAVPIHMMLPTKKHVLIGLSELRFLMQQLTDVPSHKKTTKICGYNTINNIYHDRQNYYQNSMVMCQAVPGNHCQDHVRYLLEISGPRSDRTIEYPEPIAILTDLEKNLTCIESSMQATGLIQDAYGVWTYSPQSQHKSWIPDATTKKKFLM